MSLPKNNRLSLRLYKDSFSEGKKIHVKHFTLILSTLLDQQLTQPTFAILVSKKTAKKAHDRNKIRRLTSSAIQNLIYQFPPNQYLVVPKNSILTTAFSEILSDLSSILPKLNK